MTDDQSYTFIFSQIQKIISDNLQIDLEKITINSHLKEDLNLDYYESIELIMILEEHFDIQIPDNILETTNKHTIPSQNISYNNSSVGGLFGNAWTRDYSKLLFLDDYYIDCTLLKIIKHIYMERQQEIDL